MQFARHNDYITYYDKTFDELYKIMLHLIRLFICNYISALHIFQLLQVT